MSRRSGTEFDMGCPEDRSINDLSTYGKLKIQSWPIRTVSCSQCWPGLSPDIPKRLSSGSQLSAHLVFFFSFLSSFHRMWPTACNLKSRTLLSVVTVLGGLTQSIAAEKVFALSHASTSHESKQVHVVKPFSGVFDSYCLYICIEIIETCDKVTKLTASCGVGALLQFDSRIEQM